MRDGVRGEAIVRAGSSRRSRLNYRGRHRLFGFRETAAITILIKSRVIPSDQGPMERPATRAYYSPHRRRRGRGPRHSDEVMIRSASAVEIRSESADARRKR